MANRDFYYEIAPVMGIASQTLTATSTSAAIDVRNYDKVAIIANVGSATIAPSTTNSFALVVKESSSSAGTYTAVAATDLIGAVSGTAIGAYALINSTAKPNNVYKAAYVGGKRWLRVGAVETGTAAVRLSVTVIGGDLNYAPQ